MEVACKARAAQLAADMHAMALAKVCGLAPRVGGWMQGVTFYGAPGWHMKLLTQPLRWKPEGQSTTII